MTIFYKRDLVNVDWAAMKDAVSRDSFDNGRTSLQLQVSFQNSFSSCIAYDEAQIVGTARVLSDGVGNAYIVDVWTLSAYRLRGIARTMMELLLRELQGQHVCLFTDEAVEFYRKLGFKECEVGMEKIVGTYLQNHA